ncbi:MAG: hypothetical protein WD401_03820 [Thermomicrobiaceae bacterium]
MTTVYKFGITLDTDEYFSSSEYRTTLQNVEKLLRHLSRSVAGKDTTWQWAGDTAFFMATSPNGTSEDQLSRVVDLAHQGFASASNASETGHISWPEGYDDDAKAVVSRVLKRLNDVEAIRVSATNHEELVITSANIGERITAKRVQRAYSSVEGTVETISQRSGLHFSLREVGTGLVVQCYFSEDRLQEVLRQFNQRVLVEGKVAYNKQGLPTSVREIIEIYQRGSSRKLSEFRGAIPDILGDQDGDEFIERMRGE